MERILLIDGSSLIFRAFYAIRHLSTGDGIPTNGVYGFLSMYYKAIEEYKPDYVCVAFDRSGPTFRTKDYEDYKAGRQKTPSELTTQFGILKDVLDSMGVYQLDLDGYEADDILGTLAKEAQSQGIEAICLTGDRDYLQLVDKHIRVVLTKKGITNTEIYDEAKIKEEYGISPLDLIEVKGLMGDKSDNIPGVPGVGEKTALKLIKEYGSIEKIYENIGEISGKKLTENLIENKDLAFMSRSLGEIFLNVPIETDIGHYKFKEPDYEELRKTFEALEFNSFLSYLPDEEVEKFEFTYERLSKENIAGLVEEIKKAESFTFKIFYNEDSYISSYPIGLGIKPRGGKIRVGIFSDDLEEDFVFHKLDEVFSSDYRKISFDIKPDIFYFFSKDGSLANYRDNMIAEYLVDPSKTSYSVDAQARDYLNVNINSLEDLRGKGKSMKTLNQLDKKVLEDYIANYIAVTEKVEAKLEGVLESREMTKLYEEIELPLIEVLASMEKAGIHVDKDILVEISKDLEERIAEISQKIYGYAGEDFNINSPKQLGVVLFENLGLPVIKKTKTGYSTNQEVLDKLAGKHDIIGAIEEYRSLSKLKNTYVDGMLPLITEEGKIHTTFKQHITATGRISSQEPNLQNIPIRTEDGRKIRKAFVASEGADFVDADYSQIELKVLASLSNDEAMLEAFETNKDIHTMTAAQVFHKDPSEVTRAERSDAKAVNFGIIYGISDYGLSRDLDIPRDEAEEYIARYMEAYPGIKTYMDEIIEEGKSKGYVTTMFNRRRYIPELASSNFNIRKFGERIALNTPIQGTAADIIKIAMVNTYKNLKEGGFKSKLVLQVHDELIIDAYGEELEEIKVLLKETMEGAADLKADISVELSTGKSWYEA